MSNMTNEMESVTPPAVAYSNLTAAVFEDIADSLIGFIPHGLEIIYDRILKGIPLIGLLFAHTWLEQLLKLATGITIGKGIARDTARFIFKPLGFFIGFLFGSIFFKPLEKPLSYQGKWGNLIRGLAGGVIACALLGILVCTGAEGIWGYHWFPFSILMTYSIFGVVGAFIGLCIQWIIFYAIQSVKQSQAQSHQAIYMQARELCKSVTQLARRQAKGRILTQAQDIIQQVNGRQSQQYLEQYFEDKYDSIAHHIYEKIDRHIQYLTDRACNGDVRAFKKLNELNFTGKSSQAKITVLSQLLNKIFNPRAILKLKDEVDTTFDKWIYAK